MRRFLSSFSHFVGNGPIFFIATCVTLATTLLLGGSGDSYVILSATIQLVSLALIALAICTPAIERTGRFTLFGKILSIGILALPLCHLIPLPASVWTALPGRAPALEVLATIGAPPSMHPLSLDPAATLAAALELLPGIALFWAAARLTPARQRQLLAIVVLFAFASATLGAFQRAAGFGLGFADAHAAYGPGLFVNRNHQATLMLVAIVLVPGVVGRGLGLAVPFAVLVFAGGVVATTSRAGLTLLPVAIAVAAWLTLDRRLRPREALAGLAFLALVGTAAYAGGAIRLVADRFSDGSDRFAFWKATIAAMSDFAPWGSGISTLPTTLPLHESDMMVGEFRVPAAHNDVLQLAAEGGIPALLLLAAGIALLAAAAWRAGGGRISAGASAAIALIAIHSIVDFPLRMMALSGLFGLLAAIALTGADRR